MAQRAVRPKLVVIDPPRLNLAPRVVDGQELLQTQYRGGSRRGRTVPQGRRTVRAL